MNRTVYQIIELDPETKDVMQILAECTNIDIAKQIATALHTPGMALHVMQLLRLQYPLLSRKIWKVG